MLSFAASPPHREGVEMGGEERPSGMRDEEKEQLQPSALWGGPAWAFVLAAPARAGGLPWR